VCGVAVVDDWNDDDGDDDDHINDDDDDDGHGIEEFDEKGGKDHAVCRSSSITLHLSPLAAHTLCVSPLHCCKVTCDV